MERRIQERKKEFKKNFEDPRRKREDCQLQIRKQKREENFQKKRNQVIGFGMNNNNNNNISSIGEEGEGRRLLNDKNISSLGLLSSSNNNILSYNMNRNNNNNNNNIIIADNNNNHSFSSSIITTNDNNNNNISLMAAGVFSNDAATEFDCTQKFRRILSIEQNPPIQQVIDSGVVTKFVEFLNCDDKPLLQFEAAWALTNIASGTKEQTEVVVSHNAIPIFVRLLSSANNDIREQAVWALGNIAGDSSVCRDLVLSNGVLQPLLNQLNDTGNNSMLRNATWTLSNLCRGKPPPFFQVLKPALPALSQLIKNADIEVLTDACWALSYLSDGPNDNIDGVLQVNVCKRLVDLLIHPSALVQTAALRTVGNIVTGNDAQTQEVILCGALPNLAILLSSLKKGIKKETCWTISNITAGNRQQIQAVIDNKLIMPLVETINNAEFDIKKEAAWAICNAMSGGSSDQIEYLASCNCIKPIIDLLRIDDTKIISVALDAIENMLKAGQDAAKDSPDKENVYANLIEQFDGVTAIEELQDNKSEEIYDKAYNIIISYFQYEEEEENDVSTKFNFGAETLQERIDFNGP